MQSPVASLQEWTRNSPMLRILLIGFLICLLQIPVAMIDALIYERQSTRDQAVEEVAGKWGREQSVLGPRIVVPFLFHQSVTNAEGKTSVHTVQRVAHFLPEVLDVSGRIDSEMRYRGIFAVPVYRMSLRVEGRFQKPDFTDWQVPPQDVLWDRAQLWLAISDARAIQASTALQWNDAELEFLAGTGDFAGSAQGIHASLRSRLEAESFTFSFPLELNGSQRAFFAPLGDQSKVHLSSDWKDPSFQGNWLPASRTVNEQGFEAAWSVSALGRNYPSRWIDDGRNLEGAIHSSQVGVELLSPVNPYRMAQRSVKYEVLFLALTFLVLWLFEVVGRLRVHPVQYLLVGAAMGLFYLLELSLSEHLGFELAYFVAACSVALLISGYCIAVLKGFRRAAATGGVIGILYGYLYLLLMNQDYALLVGSIGLFVILGIVMALTQKIDWYEPANRG